MLEQENPGRLDDCLEEEAAETLDGFDELLVVELGRIELLGFHLDGVGGISGDGLFVRGNRTAR